MNSVLRRTFGYFALGICVVLVAVTVVVRAGDVSPAHPDSKDSKPKLKNRKRTPPTEAEGTEAPNQFSGDPVLKSKYELNGQALEVDAD